MMYEVFSTVTGKTVATVQGEAAARAMAQRCGGGFDYDRAAPGFYVVNMGGRAVACYSSRDSAESAASMRNMGSDNDSFSVKAA